MKQLYSLFLVFFMLQSAVASESDRGRFLSWAIQSLKEIEKTEANLKIRDLKQKPIIEVTELIRQDLPVQDDILNLQVEKDIFYTEIFEVFQGDFKKASDVYWNVTLGQSKPSLFIESGAGRFEKIKILKKEMYLAEFISDRIYESKLAYNTRQTARLRKFIFHSDNRVIIVNEQVKDWGEILKEKKVKKEGKFYFPVNFDLNIDIYHAVEKNKFLYASFSTYQGQGLSTPYSSLNAAKGLGNLLSFGMLKKGLGRTVKKGALATWEKRKSVFQKLILRK